MEKMKKIAILGSTGSIGTQTLEVARENLHQYLARKNLLRVPLAEL